MKGVFLYDYDVNTEEINYEIFLGYIYYHKRMPNKTGELFANLVSNLLKTKINSLSNRKLTNWLWNFSQKKSSEPLPAEVIH